MGMGIEISRQPCWDECKYLESTIGYEAEKNLNNMSIRCNFPPYRGPKARVRKQSVTMLTVRWCSY